MILKDRNVFRLFLYLALAILSVEVVVLFFQNQNLKAQIEKLSIQPVAILKTGDKVEPFSVFRLSGDSLEVKYESIDRSTMLWFFTTTCSACQKNLEIWNDIYYENQRSNFYEIIPISLDSIEESRRFFDDMKLPYEVYSLTRHREVIGKYKISNVPQTIIVGEGGVIRKAISGVLTSEDKAELFSKSHL